MPNYDRDQAIDDEREESLRKSLRFPFGAILTAVSPDTESGFFSHYGNSAQALTLTHPFISQKSWIRAMPEGGTNFVLQFRSDEAKPQIMTTVQRGARNKIASYKNGLSLYRPLLPGEIDMLSSGNAQIFMSRRPSIETYGGMIRRWADQDKMVAGDRAPIHHRQGLQYRSNTLGDEDRFGIVSRPKENEDGTFSSWEKRYPKVRGSFTAEHYQQLRNPGNEEPAILFRKQSGHVLNQKGFALAHSRSGNALRHVEEYFANDDTATTVEIDEAGNYALSLGTGAAFGYDLLIPSGGYNRVVDLDEKATIRGDLTYQIQKNAIYQIGETLRFNIGGLFELRSRGGGQTMQFSDVAGETKFALTTGGGHSFIMDDTSDTETINVIHSSGSRLTFDKVGSVKMNAGDGSNLYMNAATLTTSLTSGLGTYVSMGQDVRLVSPFQALILDGKTTAQLQSNLNILLNSPKLDVQCGSIALGALAAFSATLAEPLALLFDLHIHATPTGPSGPPLPPNTAALINANPATAFSSAFIKMKGNLV